MLLTVDTDEDDIGNIQLVSPHVDDIVLGEPVSSDWRPVPPLGIFRMIVKWINSRGNSKFLVYQKIRPEIGEKLLKQGITNIEQLGKKEKTKKIEKVSVVKNVQKVVLPKKKPIVFHPIPIYHYIPYFRHTFSHHTTQRHRHFFY